ncbi:MAG: hypothetical protein JWP87_3916 [Labilithrix sp.]|nr:hypothetical protein [Labilithrix sp.]
MTSRARVVGMAMVGCVLALAALAACQGDAATADPCTNIPAGGCPLSRGVACQDPSCEAVYACRENNVWELSQTCPPHEGGVPREASSDAPVDATHAFDAAIDAPPGASGGPGCEMLQTPDCTLGFALACPSGCCGCEDLFVCENGGWTYWATCKE